MSSGKRNALLLYVNFGLFRRRVRMLTLGSILAMVCPVVFASAELTAASDPLPAGGWVNVPGLVVEVTVPNEPYEIAATLSIPASVEARITTGYMQTPLVSLARGSMPRVLVAQVPQPGHDPVPGDDGTVYFVQIQSEAPAVVDPVSSLEASTL